MRELALREHAICSLCQEKILSGGLPLFGWQVTVTQNLALGAIYTGISIARSYAVRRWFNARIAAAAARLAETAR